MQVEQRAGQDGNKQMKKVCRFDVIIYKTDKNNWVEFAIFKNINFYIYGCDHKIVIMFFKYEINICIK